MLDSGILTEIFRGSTVAQPDSADVFEGRLETSESIKGVESGGRISDRDDVLGTELTLYASTGLNVSDP